MFYKLLTSRFTTTLSICYIKNFVCRKFWMKHDHYEFKLYFYLIFNWKKNCWPDRVLYGTFLAPCRCTALSNQHMFFWHRTKFGVRFAEVKISKHITTYFSWWNPSNKYMFLGDQIAVFLKPFFVMNNKSHFLYYFHGTIFLKFKIFKWVCKSKSN